MNNTTDPSGEHQILLALKTLEARITRIEERLELKPIQGSELEPASSEVRSVPLAEGDEELEFRIGQAWFAKIGIVVLAVGIAFLLTFPYQNLPAAVPALFGYVLAAGMMGLAFAWRRSYLLISRYLVGGALALLYFATLRLHFFAAPPAVTDKAIIVTLLLFVVAINLTISVRRESIYLAGLTIAMGYATAIVGAAAGFVFAIIVLMSCVTVLVAIKFHWRALIILGIVASYAVHFVWAIGNPILGNELSWEIAPHINLYCILTYAVIFAAGDLIRRREEPEDYLHLFTAGLNGLACYSLYLLLTFAAFTTNMFVDHLLASLVLIGLSIALWMREKSKYQTFIYAMLGYLALSVAIVAQSHMPETFFWLSLQTVVVISTAVWFRSRFIIVANFAIYIVMFIASLFTAGGESSVGLSFGVVALLSARILNWQKDRLELKTELMRNAYLASAFFIFPYALYHLVPSGYVSLSWIGVSLFYYVASLALKSSKYRWMSLLTLIITIGYVFIFDIRNLEPTYRIASFLVLGVVLLIISVVYSRSRSRNKQD